MNSNVDDRKYAVIMWALARARGALYSAAGGEIEGVEAVLDATSLNKLAERFGYTEAELAIDWSDFLSTDEMFISGS